MAQIGEIVSGEAQFSKLPITIRTINFLGGDIANCNDMMIKDNSSPMLGSMAQMNSNVERFYTMLGLLRFDVVRSAPKEENKLAGIDFGKKAEPKVLTTKKTVITKAAKQVKYTPKELTSAKDMECNT